MKVAAVKAPGGLERIAIEERPTPVAGEVPTALAMSKNVTVKGITVGTIQDQEEMIAAIEANGLKPEIDSTYPLDQIAAAFAHQISQKHFGKICLEI